MNIELRWLDGPMIVSDSPLPEGMTASIPRRQILQYRVYHEQQAFGVPMGGNWSAWQDVPMVRWEDLSNAAVGKE